MPGTTKTYDALLESISAMPVIDCHEHMQGPHNAPTFEEPIASLIQGYVHSDLVSAGFGVSRDEMAKLQDPEVATDDKWPLFAQLWNATKHTAYARVTRNILSRVYGIDELDREALDRVAAALGPVDEARYHKVLEDAGIKALLVDVLGWSEGGIKKFARGGTEFPATFKPLISLPGLHPTSFTAQTVDYFASIFDRTVTNLDDFLEVIYEVMEKCVAAGAIGIKDQSAYSRIIEYDLETREAAERQFNAILSDPRAVLGWPEGRPLNDYLFHRYMRFAGELALPVQLHTGHMAGIRSRVTDANASHLRSVLEVHKSVRFDLFHGNWPYMGDYLFLGKNYPNVALDLCWVHIIDPYYSVQLLERGVQVVPHTKFHLFGGDYGDFPEYVVGHLEIARQNTARALANLVDSRWISHDEAIELARAWLYDNPNAFFALGLPEGDA